MRTVLLSGVVFAWLVACASGGSHAGLSPQSAAEAFLELIDQGDYQKSWAESSAWLRSNVDAGQWAEHAKSYRKPLGSVEHRKFNNVEFHDSLEDMPAGNYALVFFESSSTDRGEATEMVGLMLDEGSTWRVIGYQTL